MQFGIGWLRQFIEDQFQYVQSAYINLMPQCNVVIFLYFTASLFEYNKKVMQTVDPKYKQNFIFNPIALLTQQLKDKSMKKASIQQISTIALVLEPIKIKMELIPLLSKTFVAENLEMRVAIVRCFTNLLEYLGCGTNCFVVLQFVIDVLCVFGEEELRKQALITLQKTINFIDLRVNQSALVKVVEQLQKESQKNIREVVLKLIRFLFTVATPQNQKYLWSVLSKYKQNEEGQILLALELNEFITIMPPFPESEIHTLMKQLLQSSSAKVRSKLINPILLLTKVINEASTKDYFLALLNDTNSEVISSLVLQMKQIKTVFSEQIYEQLLALIDRFQIHDNSVKNSILQVLQQIPLTAERRKILLATANFKFLNLSKTLANSLCKIHDIEALNNLIDNSDTEFKNKLFPKLPPVCQIHLKLIQNIFGQKNWRSKLTLLQNIQKRLQNQQNVEILILKLLQQLGDKIAVFRMGIVKLVSLIVITRKLHLKQFERQLGVSITSQNWFQRQAVLLLLEQLSKCYAAMDKHDKAVMKSLLQAVQKQKVNSLMTLAESIGRTCQLQFD